MIDQLLAKDWHLFDVYDKFNDNRIGGRICNLGDHQYGALHIDSVNGIQVPYQHIYCTPKLHYPFSKVGHDRFYSWPNTNAVVAYEKLDGTNICAYSYADANGKRYVTYKTRLSPVLQNTGWGDFYDMWCEMLDKYHPNMPEVLSGEYTFSFELYGYRNQHLIVYDRPLDAKLLFAIKQKDFSVVLPENVICNEDMKLQPALIIFPKTSDVITTEYNTLRADAEAMNTPTPDGNIHGTEGYVFYVKDNRNRYVQYKCKPESVERIHFAGDFIPNEVILQTVWNSLETGEPTITLVAELLAEEYTDIQIKKSYSRIEECLEKVLVRLRWRAIVAQRYKEIGYSFRFNGKAVVMRAMSHYFPKECMSDVYSALRELGFTDG